MDTNNMQNALEAKDAEIATLKACVAKYEANVLVAKNRELDQPTPIQSAEVSELRKLAPKVRFMWTSLFTNKATGIQFSLGTDARADIDAMAEELLESPKIDTAKVYEVAVMKRADYEALAISAEPIADVSALTDEIGTPAAQWRADSESDPHGSRYDCERAALALGDMTDDELANAVFLYGNERPSMDAVIAGRAMMPIVYLTAAKDRIRWLSRKLVESCVARAAAPVSGPSRAEFIKRVLLSVAEIPDRDSPEDHPEMMLVTGDELKGILLSAFEREDEAAPVSEQGAVLGKARVKGDTWFTIPADLVDKYALMGYESRSLFLDSRLRSEDSQQAYDEGRKSAPSDREVCVVEGGEGRALCVGSCAVSGVCTWKSAAPVAQGIATSHQQLAELAIPDESDEFRRGFVAAKNVALDVTRAARRVAQGEALTDGATIELGHGATIKRETKTTGAVGWLLYNEHGLVRALQPFEIELVESVLAKRPGSAT